MSEMALANQEEAVLATFDFLGDPGDIDDEGDMSDEEENADTDGDSDETVLGGLHGFGRSRVVYDQYNNNNFPK